MSDTSYEKTKSAMLGYMQGTGAVVDIELSNVVSKICDDTWSREDLKQEVEAILYRVRDCNLHVEKTLKDSYEETMNALKI